MEVKVKAYAGAADLFDVIIESIIAETKKVTGKEITREQVMEGYKYKRKVKQGKEFVDATTHIKTPILNKEIHVTVAYPTENYEMIYTLEPISEKETWVNFQQKQAKEATNGIVKFLFRRKINKRVNQMVDYINAKKQQAEKEAKKAEKQQEESK